MKRNNYIQNKSLRTFFIASVLISLVSQINTLVDGVIVSRFVSPDALSVLSLAFPIMNTLFIFAGMVGMGASILVSKETGMQNYPKVSKMFVSGLITSVVVTTLIGFGCIVFTDNIAGLITDEERLLPLLQRYMPVAFVGCIVSAAAALAMAFAKSGGHAEQVTRAVLISSSSNIILDLLFVGVFSMGIEGAAWASVLSTIFALLFLVYHLFHKDSCISWTKPEKAWFIYCCQRTYGNQ